MTPPTEIEHLKEMLVRLRALRYYLEALDAELEKRAS
jgi:hypothetical protein